MGNFRRIGIISVDFEHGDGTSHFAIRFWTSATTFILFRYNKGNNMFIITEWDGNDWIYLKEI